MTSISPQRQCQRSYHYVGIDIPHASTSLNKPTDGYTDNIIDYHYNGNNTIRYLLRQSCDILKLNT